jgi:outer membrane protein
MTSKIQEIKESEMKIIRLFICICAISLATTALAADETKLGAVDFRKVAQESEAGKKAASTLKEMNEKYQAQLNERAKDLEKLRKAFVDKMKDLPPAKRVAKEKELQKKFQEYREFGQKAEQEMAKKDKEVSDKIGEALEKVIKEYGKNNGYTVIVQKEGFIYSDGKHEVKDLTDEIQKLFDAEGKKKTD